MFKLAKYLKPFIGLILASIVLLFVQAQADLSLPDYMSKIVNVGIQQHGMENAVPTAIRQEQMDKLTLFMDENEKSAVMRHYALVGKNSAGYLQYKNDYPVLTKKQIYVLKDSNQLTIDTLNPILGKAFLTVSGIEKMKSQAKGGNMSFNGHSIPAGTDLFMLFKKMPQDQRISIMNQKLRKITVLGNRMIVQAASGAIKNEYDAIGIDTNKIQRDYILHAGMVMLLISLVSAAAIILVGFLSSKAASGLARNLRKIIFTKVEGFSNTELDKFSTASLITRTTNDITQIQMFIVIMIRMVFYAPILGIGGIVKAVNESTSMSWIIAVAVLSLLLLIAIVFMSALPKFKVIQKLIDRLNLVTRENLSGMMVIRAFNTQKFEEERFDKANQNLTRTNLFVNRVMVIMFPTMMLIMNGIVLLIVWVGAHQIANSSMQVGDMMAFMQYAMQIIFAFLMMSFMFIMIPRASVSAQRIAEVLEVELEINDPKNPVEFNTGLKGVIEFRNVSFRYHGAEDDALKNISFTSQPGQTTAVIGSTGSGKTTLVNMIPRFYDVTNGQVLVDGIDVRETTQHKLREKIGYIPQKSSLFSGTIESNLKYADETATQADIQNVAEIAQAMEFISGNSEGFAAEVSQGGANLSGGQKQRLSIARALMKKPEIFIFDDSFSALDFKTESALRKALSEKVESSTILIVAQRISTIMNAEQIIVLDEGKIVGKGTHRELMEQSETYQEIAYSQLSEEELG